MWLRAAQHSTVAGSLCLLAAAAAAAVEQCTLSSKVTPKSSGLIKHTVQQQLLLPGDKGCMLLRLLSSRSGSCGDVSACVCNVCMQCGDTMGADLYTACFLLSPHLQVIAARQQLQHPPGDTAAGAIDASSSSGSAPSTCAAIAAAAAAASTEREMSLLRTRVLSQAGLVLGYLAFDGEGTRSDKQEAVKYFKLAAQAGCKEAQQVLGWIFNTGQF